MRSKNARCHVDYLLRTYRQLASMPYAVGLLVKSLCPTAVFQHPDSISLQKLACKILLSMPGSGEQVAESVCCAHHKVNAT